MNHPTVCAYCGHELIQSSHMHYIIWKHRNNPKRPYCNKPSPSRKDCERRHECMRDIDDFMAGINLHDAAYIKGFADKLNDALKRIETRR